MATPPTPQSQPGMPPVPAAAGIDTTPSDTAAPGAADDGDLIEPQWVAKVKQVMSANAQDPFELNRQFTLLKADYMQKRYGKSLKSDD